MRRLVLVCSLVALASAALVACDGGSGEGADAGGLEVVDLSSRPELSSGDEALVAIEGDGVRADEVRIEVDGTDVTEDAGVAERDGQVLALVPDLDPGPHTVTATAGDASGSIEITAHPITGPIISGEHLPLEVCTTEDNDLGPATDDDCSADTVVRWWYRSTEASNDNPVPLVPDAPAGFKPLADPSERPADLATATVDGAEVPYIVREERGTINRGVYSFAVLAPDGEVSYATDNPGWNERLVYRFGGGCGTTYGQGEPLGNDVIDHDLLAHGYAIATSTFNVFQTHCNDVLSAETLMMVKQHLVEEMGPPRFTIGDGGSGGAIQQLLIAQNYPGMLDAIAPAVPFPDAISIAPGVTDCGLLVNYYEGPGAALSTEQRAAINGQLTPGTCELWDATFVPTADPTVGCDPSIPPGEIYSAENPDGLRCTLMDTNRNILGVDPDTGFALRPVSNVGVQYGLEALEAGVITPDQFLDLNERIGGLDIDGQFVAERHTADEEAFRHTYETGRVDVGAGDLREIPVLLTNVYTDPEGDIHDRYRVFEIRDRIAGPDGEAPNVVIVTVPAASGDAIRALTGAISGSFERIDLLDRWLTDGERPADAVDTCTLPDGETLTGDDVYEGSNACTSAYPVYGDPRTAAGGPQIGDVLSCQLVEPARDDYDVAFTDEQWSRLQGIFTDGVCDWSKPSLGQTEPDGTWRVY